MKSLKVLIVIVEAVMLSASANCQEKLSSEMLGKTEFRNLGAYRAGAWVSAIAVAPSNPVVVWVGTGESYNARSSYAGNGIYKSTDGGETYTNMGLKDSHHISKMNDDKNNVSSWTAYLFNQIFCNQMERNIIKQYSLKNPGNSR